VFLRGYYSIHDNSDHANARIGFAPHSTSSKVKVEADVTLPANNIDDYLWELTWLYDISPKKNFMWTQFFYRWAGNSWVYWFGIK
jgi:FAD/FMN-containing dehydrogenase